MAAEHGMATANGIRVHYVRDGDGPPVVLLHGWPQTWYCWRRLVPLLAGRRTVIAPDLRGYGLSDKPPGGYDKRTMAADVRALVRGLGLERPALVGHDRGARVAHRWALDHPDEIERVAVLDVIPTRAMFQRLDVRIARGFWHWLFHLQPDLPELLAGADVGRYLRWFFERWAHNRPPVEEAVEEYVRAFSAPGALRAGFDDYRATFPDDLDADEASAAAGQRLTMPVLALWGATGLTGQLPVLEIWREYATDVDGGAIQECGHFLPEERPEEVAARLLRFLGEPAPGG
ncbi:MAG TPA: alpha/beta hydrolase [Actinomycetes bacterium]|nr:alpha/beta hydrolase [Actinomycetes bacterium]